MLPLTIKILLATFAFAIATLGVSDLKSLRENSTTPGLPWFKRLTNWGALKIGIALGTLLLVGANEWVSYSKAYDASIAAKEAALRAAEREEELRNNLYILQLANKIEALDLDSPTSDGVFIIELAYPAKYTKEFIGPFPYLGKIGDISEFVLLIEDSVSYSFVITGTTEGIIIHSEADGSDCLITVEDNHCPWEGSIDVPAGVWTTEMIAPSNVQLFGVMPRGSFRKMLASLQLENMGYMSVNHKIIGIENFESVDSHVSSLPMNLKLRLPIKNENNDDCEFSTALYIDAGAQFDHQDETNWYWRIAATRAPRIDPCDEPSF